MKFIQISISSSSAQSLEKTANLLQQSLSGVSFTANWTESLNFQRDALLLNGVSPFSDNTPLSLKMLFFGDNSSGIVSDQIGFLKTTTGLFLLTAENTSFASSSLLDLANSFFHLTRLLSGLLRFHGSLHGFHAHHLFTHLLIGFG